MKYIVTFLICTLCILTGVGQTNLSENQLKIPEKTPELQALYQQAKQLGNTGTAAEINANRLAIKNAWQLVDPDVAVLYKEVSPAMTPVVELGEYSDTRSPEEWGVDKLVHEGIIDGFDMSVARNGNIYISVIENLVDNDANLLVYRSTNNGGSFELWSDLTIFDVDLDKIETISIDGNGEDYLVAYMNSYTSFFAIKINVATNTFEMQGISNDVIDFSVDRNYPATTATQRVFATYIKYVGGATTLYSARSTAGNYGLNWVDEIEIATNIQGVAFAYGRDGGCYTAFIDADSGDLYATANPNYNDPGSWESNENLWSGTYDQMMQPTIRAARKAPANDHVFIGVPIKPSYSEKFLYRSFVRKNSNNYSTIGVITPSNDGHYLYMDSWVRREDDVDTIRTSFVNTYNFDKNVNYSRTYNGDETFEWAKRVIDHDKSAFSGYRSIIAETSDHLPCMAFAGDKLNGEYAENVYFDAKTDLVGVAGNTLDDFYFYPNPAKNNLNLSANSIIENVELYSLLGQQVMQISPEEETASLKITSLATGIYVMKVEVNGETGTYKIIKE